LQPAAAPAAAAPAPWLRRGRGGGRLCVRLGSGIIGGLEREDRRALRYPVADLELQLLDDASGGRRDFERCLVGLQRNEGVFLLDGVPRLDEHLDDRHVLEVADVGNLYLDDVAHGKPIQATESTESTERTVNTGSSFKLQEPDFSHCDLRVLCGQ